MPFDVAQTLQERHGENFQLHGELHEPPAGPGPQDDRLRPLLRPGRGLLPLRRRGPALPRLPVRLRRLRPRPEPPGDQAGAPPGHRPRPAQHGPDGLRAAARPAGRGSSWPGAHDGIDRVFFCNSGAEAIEAAIKFARHATRRPRIVYCDHAFHGLTHRRAVAERRRRVPQGLRAAACRSDRGALRRHRRACAASCGAATWPPSSSSRSRARASTWRPTSTGAAAQELCRQHKTLLVIDEVQTGLGRTGKFFCHEHWGLEPDIITVSKALSGGYVPVGAMLCSDEGLHERLQLHGPRAGALVDLRPQPAGHGGRAGHPAGLRRRGHRRPGPPRPARRSRRRSRRSSSATRCSTRSGARAS